MNIDQKLTNINLKVIIFHYGDVKNVYLREKYVPIALLCINTKDSITNCVIEIIKLVENIN